MRNDNAFNKFGYINIACIPIRIDLRRKYNQSKWHSLGFMNLTDKIQFIIPNKVRVLTI